MALKTTISNGAGTNLEAEVTEERALRVNDNRLPPVDVRIKPFRQYLTDDGLPSDGSNFDMQVDGSSTNVDYYIASSSDSERYIDSISIVIADASAALNKFGNITALSNGVEIFYEDSTLGNVVIADSLKTNFEFIRLCGAGASPIGTGSNSYRASNVEGNSEGYIMTLDFSDQFGMPWGIHLAKNSTLRLVVRIKDNTTGVDAFNMIAYGYDRVVDE